MRAITFSVQDADLIASVAAKSPAIAKSGQNGEVAPQLYRQQSRRTCGRRQFRRCAFCTDKRVGSCRWNAPASTSGSSGVLRSCACLEIGMRWHVMWVMTCIASLCGECVPPSRLTRRAAELLTDIEKQAARALDDENKPTGSTYRTQPSRFRLTK
jgi:hypothetical protein